MIREHLFEDREALAAGLAASIAGSLGDALEQRSKATLVVSGGSTPVALFRALRRVELDWHRVQITLADERWVDPCDQNSNQRLVRDELLEEAAAQASFLGLWSRASSPESGCQKIEPALARLRPFDVVVLGMGADGHTASLFPQAPNLGEILDPSSQRTCVVVRPPDSPWPRVSLSLAALLDSRRLVLHITGSEKWRVLQQALQPGSPEDLPIRAVLEDAPSGVDVYWSQ